MDVDWCACRHMTQPYAKYCACLCSLHRMINRQSNIYLLSPSTVWVSSSPCVLRAVYPRTTKYTMTNWVHCTFFVFDIVQIEDTIK